MRFATSRQIAQLQRKPGPKAIQKRLKILEDQGLINKRYAPSYKLRGRPASYYVTPQGARAFLQHTGQTATPEQLGHLYKNKLVSEDHIDHRLALTDVFIALGSVYPYGAALSFYTRYQLHPQQYDLFPQPLQDAWIKLDTARPQQSRQFLLDLSMAHQPFFVIVRRIKQYLQYLENGDWDAYSSEPPTILLVADTPRLHARLRKRLARELADYSDFSFATARLTDLRSTDYDDRVWLAADPDSDDPDEVPIARKLTELPVGE